MNLISFFLGPAKTVPEMKIKFGIQSRSWTDYGFSLNSFKGWHGVTHGQGHRLWRLRKCSIQNWVLQSSIWYYLSGSSLSTCGIRRHSSKLASDLGDKWLDSSFKLSYMWNNANTGSIPDPGRPHMPHSNRAHLPQLLSLCSRVWEPQLLKPMHPRACALQQEKPLQ